MAHAKSPWWTLCISNANCQAKWWREIESEKETVCLLKNKQMTKSGPWSKAINIEGHRSNFFFMIVIFLSTFLLLLILSTNLRLATKNENRFTSIATNRIWENFLICERIKFNRNNRIDVNAFFWRSHQQQEIDYLEDIGGRLTGYEMKWGTKKHRIPKVFLSTYKGSTIEKIDRTNFLQFVNP